MMKQNRLFKTLFVLVLVVLGYTNMLAQNGNIQFADSHVKEICVQNWDTNGDGELSYDEAAAVTSLSNALFQGNEDITSFDELQYFTGITEIPYSSFMQCVNLTSVILPPNVHDIETMAFFGCTSLTSVYLHDQVVNVGANAWSGCSSVSSVYIGANVATFNVNPFGEMTNLEAFDVSPDNVTFASIDGLLMSADGTSLIQYPAGKHDVEFVIGSSITQVGSDAFRGCAYLKKLTVTQNSQVSTNDNNSYWYITSLEEVVFNEGIQEIGANSFMGCSSLTTIHFPSTLTYLGSSSFSGCNAINKIYSDVVTPFSFTDDVFTDDVYHYADVVVPDGSKPAYKETAGWSNFQCFQTDTPVVTNPEPYAVLSDNNTVLTFYYDDKKAERNGMSVGPFHLSGYQPWYDNISTLTTVVLDASFANCTSITNTDYWFDHCENITSIIGLGNLNTSNVTSMYNMFWGCYHLTELDVTGFNTEKVTDMSGMFAYCSNLASIDVSHFNTSNVTKMAAMFAGCESLTTLDLSHFDTSNVTNMGGMFDDCYMLTTIDLSSFNTGNVTTMSGMFSDCQKLASIDVSGFNTSNVTSMSSMFYGCKSLSSINVSNFNTEKVEEMDRMFYICSGLTALDVSNFNTSNVTNMSGFFSGCSGLTSLNVSSFDTGKVTNMKNMFSDCSALTSLDVSNFNTENVTDMTFMFSRCNGLASLDLSSFNTSSVTKMPSMFFDNPNLKTIYVGDGWTTSSVTSGGDTFTQCPVLVGGKGTYYNPDHTDYTYARIDGGPNSITPGYFTEKNGQNVLSVANITLPQNSEAPLIVSYQFDAADKYTAYQFELELPEDLEFVMAGGTDVAFVKGDCHDDSHLVEANLVGGVLKVVGLSTTNAPLNGTSGVLLTFTIKPKSAVTVGQSFTGFIKNIEIVPVEGEKKVLAPSSFTVTIDQQASFEPYAVLSDNNSILTFYYDEKKAERNGMDVGPFENAGGRGWENARTNITTVVFDDSFANCTELTSTAFWFYGCDHLTEIVGISNLKTDNVTNMEWMFRGCSGLTILDVSGFKTENVFDFGLMFMDCSSLTSLDISNFKTDNMLYMNYMFYDCSGLTTLDMSNFKTDKVTAIDHMFYNCSGLTTIYAGNDWTTAAVTSGEDVFAGCTNLVGGKGTAYNPDHVDYTYARIDGGPNSTTPGYFTDKNAIVEYALDAEVVAIASGHISISSVMDTEGMWSESYHYKLTINPDNNPKVVANAVASPASLDYFQFNWYGGYLFVGNYTGVSANIDAGVLKSNFQKLTITPTNIENLVDGATYTFKLTAYETVQNTEVARRETTISLTKLMPTEANLLTFRPNQETTDGSGEVISYMTPNKQGTIANAYAPFADNNFAPSQTTAEIEACYDARDAKASNGFKNLSNIFYNLSVNGQNGYNSGTYDENEWDKTFEFMFGTSNADGTSALVDANGKGISFAHPQGLQTSQKYMLEIPAELIDGTTKHTLDIYKVYPGISTELNNDGSVHHFNEDYPVANGQHLNFTYACWHHANTFAWESPDKTPQLQWSSAGSEGTAPFTDIVSMNTYDPDYFGNGTATGKTLANLTAKYFLTGFDNVQLNSMADGTGQINSYYIPSIDGETITFTQASTQAAAAPDADHTEYLIITAKDAFNHDVRIVLDVQIKVPVVTDPEPYAALSENNTVLTFYYDTEKEQRNGMSVGPFQSYYQPWGTYRKDITAVVFDDSFSGCTTLTSTAYWFYDFRSLTEIIGIQNLKTDNVIDMSDMFDTCSSLTSLDVSGFNTENVTNMYRLFYQCSNLTSIDVSNFNTANVTNMVHLFCGCKSLTSIDVSNFNTANLESMSGMFESCSGLTNLDVSNLNTAKVEYMTWLFKDCNSLTNINFGNFDTSNVKSMSEMFSGCSKLTNIDMSSFSTAMVTDIGHMFEDCRKLTSIDLSNFNTLNVDNMSCTFRNCSGLTSLDLSNFSTPKLTGMYETFYGCSGLTSLDLSNFNTTHVTYMGGTFANCSKLENLDISNFNTISVERMHDMFNGCSSLTTLDLSSFNTEKVWNMEDMFNRCYALTTVYVSNLWSNAIVTSSNNMFNECSALVGGAGTTYNSSNKDHTYARIDGGPNSQTPGYFTYKDAPVVTDAEPYAVLSENNTVLTFYYDKEMNARQGMPILHDGQTRTWEVDNMETIKNVVFDPSFADYRPISTYYWFQGFTNLISISGLEYLNTEEVTNMSGMFRDCSSLTTLDLSSFYTANVTTMAAMFNGCSSLRSLNITSFNTGEVTDMTGMFLACSSLTDLNVSNFNTLNTTSMMRMFSECAALTSLDLTNFDTDKVTNMGLMFDNCTSLTTIYASKGWSIANLTEGSDNMMFYNCINLVGGLGTTYDANHIDYTYAHIDGGTANPGYLTDKNAPRPYAVLSDNNTVLTFYYDEHKVERNGMDIGPFNDSDKQSWYNQRESITTAVFDESFANCTSLTSTFLWFYGCRNMVSISGIQYLKTDNVTDMSRMFDSCSSLTSLDVSGFNTENVTHMYDMFYMCSSLTSIDVSHFNTSNVKRMGWMFNGCKNLTSLDVSNFKTDNVTDMNSMFLGCSGLTSLDLSVFNTANVTNMSWMFSGCSKLTVIDISSFNTANVTDFRRMFYNCTSLASIQAGNAEIPAEEYANIGNPNLLVYVNEARLAPEGVQNVVVNGVAKEIVLTDNPDGKIVNNNWYCPEPFRAEKISYTRDFRQQTQIGISRGWESLALPFAVQTITHQDKGAIAPFGSDASGLHFWLRRLGHEGLISVQMIEPNTPYIISMPNSEDYASRFNLNGRVTFAAEDAYVERTEQMADESADYMMIPAFQRMPVSEYVYALNVGEERNGRPEGSIFERNYREVRPFEAYTLHRGDQPAPLFFDLSDLEGSTTDMPDVRWMMDDGNGEWYDLQGRKLGSTLNVQRSTLKKGVYIRNGRKIVFK